jgi:histone-lysine N-methyltransferase SETMAR
MTTENFRFYIKMRTALSIPARIIYDELNSIYGNEAPGLSTVKRWSKLFRDGREEIEDEARPGRPMTETTTENIEQVRLLIDDNPYITIEDIQEQTDLSHGTVQRIITDHLKLRKITARYIPKDLTDLQRAERVRICKQNLAKFHQGTWRLCDIITGDESWFHHKQIGRKISNKAWVSIGDPPPTVVRGSRFAPKTLFSIFFKSTGPMLIHRIERGQTIDHHYYINQCLRPLIDEIKRQRPSYGTRGIKIHHDNGRPHVHEDVSDYLESEGLTIIPHPPNSPDLSPCDFWLFSLIKDNLTDQDDSESLHDAVIDFMNSLNPNEYKKTFEKWVERMQLCVDNHGDYFEHLMK